jgi:hypothetical protein
VSTPETAPDTSASLIKDHHFVPKEGTTFSRCQYLVALKPTEEGYPGTKMCGLGEAAHAKGPIQDTDPGRPASMGGGVTPEQQEAFNRWKDVIDAKKNTNGQETVDGERQKQHGDPVSNMERFALMVTGYLGRRLSGSLTAHDAAMIQLLFKVCRSGANPGLPDNYTDMEGYAEIGRRCAGALRSHPSNP